MVALAVLFIALAVSGMLVGSVFETYHARSLEGHAPSHLPQRVGAPRAQ
jgi:hypothetical protein